MAASGVGQQVIQTGARIATCETHGVGRFHEDQVRQVAEETPSIKFLLDFRTSLQQARTWNVSSLFEAGPTRQQRPAQFVTWHGRQVHLPALARAKLPGPRAVH